MPAKTKSWKTLWPVLTALALFAICTGGWFWAKGQAEAAYKAQTETRSTKPAITCETDAWSGYPFKLQLDCTRPTIYLSRSQTQLTPKKLTALVRAPYLRTVLVKFEGPTRIQNKRLKAPVEIAHAPATLVVHLKTRHSVRAETELASIIIKQSGEEVAKIDAARLRTLLTRGDQHNIDLSFDLDNVTLHTETQNGILLEMVAASVKAGNVPREPVENGAEWLKAAAGLETMFEIENFKTRQGVTELHAKGALRIEQTGTLDGMVTTRVTKLDAFLSGLQDRQVLTPKKAKAVSTLLKLFDRGDGVATELRFKKGEMFWGPLKLGQQFRLF